MASNERPGSFGPVHIVGIGCTPLVDEHDAVLDELVFDAVFAALAECGLRKQDVGLAVQASMDVLDGRSISSGLTTAAAGGYLTDSYRLEADSGSAIIAAAQAVAAGDVEVAVAVGHDNPEVSGSDPVHRASFLDQLSSLAFEPIFDRPVGMTAHAAWGLQASYLVEHGTVTEDELAELTAAQINRGTQGPRAYRSAVSVADVLASPAVAWPLRELMLPARTTGAVAVVLCSPARAARALGRDAVITGVGQATGDYTWSAAWLTDPAAATRRAARDAYRIAGILNPSGSVDVVEASPPTPALHRLVVEALDLTGLPDERVTPSGGPASNFPGLANGGLRTLEAVEWLERAGGPGRAVVHSVDTQTGPIADDVTVLVVEAA